jgi:hypothetical protein
MNASTGSIAIGGILILAGIARVVREISKAGWQDPKSRNAIFDKTGIVLIGGGAAIVIAGLVTSN